MAILLGATPAWTTSTYTNNNGACVRVRSTDVRALDVGDTKVPDGPSVKVHAGSWTAFVESVK
ncbi:DUF397 domain-containing protein [Streptomyces sp. 4F14]|uniref:DUF397 domain-containing protein n=1 Tax=Streptomyces sp. 4F14 TaxID=3394380 RepID=UPI003A8BDA38